ncbi:MAG: hypothetical protein ABR574_01060 [Cryomorphaceae bacterium]
MRFLFIGLAILILVALLVGRIITPKHTPFRRVFARGMYISIIGLIVIGGIGALGTYIYKAVNAGGDETDFRHMSQAQREVYRDSVRQILPSPNLEELKSDFVEFDFEAVLIPCYENIHKLKVGSPKEIIELEVIGKQQTDEFYEILTRGELKVNRPVPNFHIQGTFNVQYKFIQGDADHDPGWQFHKILIDECTVLSAIDRDIKPGPETLYPDLKRNRENKEGTSEN